MGCLTTTTCENRVGDAVEHARKLQEGRQMVAEWTLSETTPATSSSSNTSRFMRCDRTTARVPVRWPNVKPNKGPNRAKCRLRLIGRCWALPVSSRGGETVLARNMRRMNWSTLTVFALLEDLEDLVSLAVLNIFHGWVVGGGSSPLPGSLAREQPNRKNKTCNDQKVRRAVSESSKLG